MSETTLSNRTRGILATGAAVGAAVIGVGEAQAQTTQAPKAAEAQAAIFNAPTQSNILQGHRLKVETERQPRVTIEDVTRQKAENITKGGDLNFYHGSVDIIDQKTGQIKMSIENPFVAFRYGETPQEEQFANEHPRSEYWAIGYIQKGVAGNLGNDNLIMLPFNNGGNNFVFHGEAQKEPAANSDDGQSPVVDVVRFHPHADGSAGLDQPFTMSGQAILDHEGHMATIGGAIAGHTPTEQ